jgi:uncharacterized protein
MPTIDEELGALLLRVARDALATTLRGDLERDVDPRLKGLHHNGAFVTLRRNGELRGCIGTFSASDELVDVVRNMAAASLEDPRFADIPVSANELPEIRIELSVLSPLESVKLPDGFTFGTHGIYLRHGNATGCFLPEVGQDLGWDKETFLRELCSNKMALRPDAWRSAQVEAWRFTVSKFAEP